MSNSSVFRARRKLLKDSDILQLYDSEFLPVIANSIIDTAPFFVRYGDSQSMASSYIGLLFLIIYSITAVCVIVGGQSTTDYDLEKSIIDQLINTVANLQTQVTKLMAENNILKGKVTKLEAQVSTKSKSLCLLFNSMCVSVYI